MIKPRPKKVLKAIPFYNVLDIETVPDGSAEDIGFAWYIDGVRHYRVFQAWDTWIAFIIPLAAKDKALRKIYAHNGANFDWISLIAWVRENKLWEKAKIVMSGSKAIGIDLKLGNKGGTLRLRDSLRLLLSSIESLSKSFKTEYKKIGLGDILPCELKKKDPDKYYAYLKNDCFSLQDILREFHKLVNERIAPIEILPMTISSLTFNLWKDNFLKKPIKTAWNPEQKDFFRRSYKGGRTDCFTLGEFKEVFGYDVNSLYPYIMSKVDVPVSYVGAWTNIFEGRGIYEIEYKQTNRAVPPLLMDGATGNFLYSGSGVYCDPEITKLKDIGAEIKIIKGYVFEFWGNPFKEYIEKLYALRLEAKNRGDLAVDHVAKIAMNSLYGKFGERPEGEELRLMDSKEYLKILEEGKEIINYGDVSSLKVSRQVLHEFCPIASFITCYARLELYKYIEYAGINAVYVDTDSIYSLAPLPDHFIDDQRLGAMKKEFQGQGIFTGKKQYALKNDKEKMVLKGVTTKGRNKADVQYLDYRELLKGLKKTYEYKSCTTVKDVLIKNRSACHWESKHKEIKATGRSEFKNQKIKVIEDIKNYTIRQFIKKNGGIKPDKVFSGELKLIPFYLKNKNGKTLDEMRLYCEVESYLPEGSTIDDLFTAINKNQSGNLFNDNLDKEFLEHLEKTG